MSSDQGSRVKHGMRPESFAKAVVMQENLIEPTLDTIQKAAPGTHRGAAALAGHLGVHDVAGRVALRVADALPQRAHGAPLLAPDVCEHLRTCRDRASSTTGEYVDTHTNEGTCRTASAMPWKNRRRQHHFVLSLHISLHMLAGAWVQP